MDFYCRPPQTDLRFLNFTQKYRKNKNSFFEIVKCLTITRTKDSHSDQPFRILYYEALPKILNFVIEKVQLPISLRPN